MKKKALAKEFFMSIKKTYNRFISICLIVMLGTAFFAGVKAAEPDMQESADIFFDDSKLMDIRVMSTLGLTEDDVTAISAIEGVESAIPVYTYDVLTEKDEKQHVVKLMSETTDIKKAGCRRSPENVWQTGFWNKIMGIKSEIRSQSALEMTRQLKTLSIHRHIRSPDSENRHIILI